MVSKKKNSTRLYKIARKLNILASSLNDVETLATGDTRKIAKRLKRKLIGKKINKLNREIMKKI